MYRGDSPPKCSEWNVNFTPSKSDLTKLSVYPLSMKTSFARTLFNASRVRKIRPLPQCRSFFPTSHNRRMKLGQIDGKGKQRTIEPYFGNSNASFIEFSKSSLANLITISNKFSTFDRTWTHTRSKSGNVHHTIQSEITNDYRKPHVLSNISEKNEKDTMNVFNHDLDYAPVNLEERGKIEYKLTRARQYFGRNIFRQVTPVEYSTTSLKTSISHHKSNAFHQTLPSSLSAQHGSRNHSSQHAKSNNYNNLDKEDE